MAQRPLAILLPPSEGKAEGGRSPAWNPGSGRFGRQLGSHRRSVAEALAAADGGDARLLGVKGVHLERARAVNRFLVGSPTLTAFERYTGVVWDHLDIETMSARTRARAEDSVVVVSGLLGLVGIIDRIPEYKLKMGAALPHLGKLSTWWRPKLSAVLNSWLLADGGRVVIDLLPQEHRAAWEVDPELGQNHIVVNFVNRSGRAVGHDAKAAKGLLARHLLESKGAAAGALASWRHPQFSLELL
ncbi:MAG: YaaA family protein [Actinomycetota bacterium]